MTLNQPSQQPVVIGVDGGGSVTRAICVDATGRVLGYAQAGGANPSHNVDAIANVQAAISAALRAAGRSTAEVAALAAGLAGLNEPADQEWAERSTALAGLVCPRIHLNDSEVAHAGALRSQPGIIAISGTGSTILAVTAGGRRLRNDDFEHYAGAARHLAFDVVHRLLAGARGPDDSAFVAALLFAWQLPNIEALRLHAAETTRRDWQQEKRAYGQLARLVTQAALDGAPLARAVCDTAANALATGIRLLGPLVGTTTVPVVLIGGLACSPAIKERLAARLQGVTEPRYQLVAPALAPVAGAALLALAQAGLPTDEPILCALRADPRTRYSTLEDAAG